MHIPTPPGDPPPLVIITQETIMAMQNNSYLPANGDDDDIGVGNKLNFYPAVDEDYETRRAEQQAESLIPLKEDLAEWIQRLLDIPITTETFLQALDNGAALCRLAFLIQSKAEEASREGKCSETIPRLRFRCRENAKSRTWYARDNTANFLRWCRDFGINEGCMFESEDLVCHRQEKPVVVCLLELARLGYRFGLEPPSIVKIEKEIEREESELASQRNDDEDLNEGADETTEVGGEDEADVNEAEKKKEEEENDDGEESKVEEGDGDAEKEKEKEKEEDHTEESEEKKLVDGMNGNGREEDSTGDAVSEGHKSRTTSHAASHVSGQNDNDEENGERDKEEEEEGEEDGEKEEGEEDKEDKEEKKEEDKEDEAVDGEKEEENEKEKEGEEEEGEGVNGTVNGTGEDENGNEEVNKDSSSETKGGDSRPNSPAKNDSGTTSPSRKSPTSPRSRIDNIKARQLDKKLLKEKHLMVRVGGGWDTLDHYLSHHSPTKILEFKRNDQTKTPATSPRHDPDTGESAAGTNNTGDEKYLVISGKYKRH